METVSQAPFPGMNGTNVTGAGGDNGGGGGPQYTAADFELREKFLRINLVCYGVILPILLVGGTVGNVLNLLVFFRARFKAVTYIYLKYLALSDLCTMVILWLAVLRYGWGVRLQSFAASFYFAHVDPVVLNCFLIAGALMVLAITVDRFIAVNLPLKACYLITTRRARVTVVGCFLLPLLCYFPLAFKMEVVPIIDFDTGEPGFGTTFNEALHDNVYYSEVYDWLQVSVFKFVPIVLVIGLNIRTMIMFWAQTKKRRRLTSVPRGAGKPRGAGTEKTRPEDTRLMAMLTCVALMYVFCITPSAIVFLTNHPSLERNLAYYLFNTLANLLEFANSALNFYMYCLCSKDFRHQFKKMIVGDDDMKRAGSTKSSGTAVVELRNASMRSESALGATEN